MIIRTLTEEGIARFSDWLNAVKTGGSAPKPAHLLIDPATSAPLADAGTVEEGSYSNRYALGLYVNSQLAAIPISSIPMTHGVWSWLSLFFIDVLATPHADGTRSLKEMVRYIPSADYQKYYRHLIGFAVHAIRNLGSDAEPLLISSKPGILHTDYCEQIYGYQDLCQTRGFIAAANALYFDPVNHKIKRGATPNKRKPGTLRRLGDVFYQLDLTYDVQGMEWTSFRALLPKEFAVWLPPS